MPLWKRRRKLRRGKLFLAALLGLQAPCTHGKAAGRSRRPPDAYSDAILRERLRAVEEFVASGGGQHCDLQRINGRGLSWASFSEKLRGRGAMILTNLDETHARTNWTRKRFLKAFGDHPIKTNNGHFDHLRTKEVTTVKEYLKANASTSNLFLADYAFGLQSDVDVALGLPVDPKLLADFNARPILSLGVKASSTHFHQHAETWQYLLAGRKAWWLTPDAKAVLPGKGGDPCAALSSWRHGAKTPAAQGSTHSLVLCVQRPGEAIYFGNNTPHATCNLESFNFGVGAQGHMEAWPVLHRAARHNDTNTVRRLIEEVGDIDAVDSLGSTALHHAVTGRHLAVVSLLVGAGASLRRKDREGKHALLMAAERGDLELVRFLAEAGAPVRKGDNSGVQAVHWTVLNGNLPVLEFLLSKGASIRAQDKKGTEPMHWAALEGDVQTLAFIQSRGGDVHTASAEGIQPLHWAAGVGHSSMVGWLLEARARPGAMDVRGTSSLHYAAAQDRIEVIRRLVEGRADVHAGSSGQQGVQPAQIAAGMGHAGALLALLAARAEPDAVDATHRRAVHSAAESGHRDVLAVLITHRAQISSLDARKRSAVQLAVDAGHLQALDVLLDAGAATPAEAPTLLSMANARGHAAVAASLLRWSEAAQHERGGAGKRRKRQSRRTSPREPAEL